MKRAVEERQCTPHQTLVVSGGVRECFFGALAENDAPLFEMRSAAGAARRALGEVGKG